MEKSYPFEYVRPEDLAAHLQRNNNEDPEPLNSFSRKFSKCDNCRRSRTQVMIPESLLSVASSRNDGITCDFCGQVMSHVQPQQLPDTFQGRRGCKGGDLVKTRQWQTDDLEWEACDSSSVEQRKKKNYVYCGECGKVVLKESLVKHVRDVHELSNKKKCHICNKVLSGPFSLKEHITVIHFEQRQKFECPHCHQMFAHLSNMNRHIRLVHERMVVTNEYVDCPVCGKVVQKTSLKRHMSLVHEQRRDFKCGLCSKSFGQKYTLKEHVAAKHTFNLDHQCRLCDKRFAHKTNCTRHLRTVHKDEMARYASEQDMIRACMILNDQNQAVSKGDPPSGEDHDDDDYYSIHSLRIAEDEEEDDEEDRQAKD